MTIRSDALRAFVDGTERRIDVGRANGRLFLNNVSLGVYARLVHRREAHRRRREAFARIRAWAILLTHRHPLGITIDGDAVESRLVLVANNAYVVDLPSLGERERLDEGKLHLYTPALIRRSASASASSSLPLRSGSRRRSTASPTCWRRRWSSASSRGALRVLVPPAESG